MYDVKRIGKRIFVMRHDNKMNMVIHETVCKDSNVEFSAVFGYKNQIMPSIGIVLEYILAVVTSLGNMMGIFRNNYSSYTRHKGILP